MSDDRTDEQRAADRQLDEAIRNVAAVYGHAEPGAVMVTDWVVLGTGIGVVDGPGGQTTVSFYLLPDGGDALNWHSLIGLVRANQLRIEHTFVTDEGIDE